MVPGNPAMDMVWGESQIVSAPCHAEHGQRGEKNSHSLHAPWFPLACAEMPVIIGENGRACFDETQGILLKNDILGAAFFLPISSCWLLTIKQSHAGYSLALK